MPRCDTLIQALCVLKLAQERKRFNYKDIQRELGCHKRTAYRWMTALSHALPLYEVEGTWPCEYQLLERED